MSPCNLTHFITSCLSWCPSACPTTLLVSSFFFFFDLLPFNIPFFHLKNKHIHFSPQECHIYECSGLCYVVHGREKSLTEWTYTSTKTKVIHKVNLVNPEFYFVRFKLESVIKSLIAVNGWTASWKLVNCTKKKEDNGELKPPKQNYQTDYQYGSHGHEYRTSHLKLHCT